MLTKMLVLGYSSNIFVILSWKQHKYSSREEWLNALWYGDTMECYLAMKKESSLFI